MNTSNGYREKEEENVKRDRGGETEGREDEWGGVGTIREAERMIFSCMFDILKGYIYLTF